MSPGTHPARVYVLRNSMCFAILTLCAAPLFALTPLEQALARMDRNAATFRSMSSNLRQLSHTAVINEDNVSTGTIRMRRMKRDAQVVVEFTAPDPKSVALSGTKAEIFYPKLNTVEEYDLGKNKDMVEKFLALGFGASGKDLQADYTLSESGQEALNGEKALHVELTPKSRNVAQQFPKIELWISEASGYPVQQKMHQTGGDYMMATYSDIQINPTLPDSAFKLSLPRGVKRVHPQK
jgi:outer membrane lipoprotein-sorting protein